MIDRPLDLERLWRRTMRSMRAFCPIAKRTARLLDEFWIRGLVILTTRPHALGNYTIHIGSVERRVFIKEAEAAP